jgi:transposase
MAKILTTEEFNRTYPDDLACLDRMYDIRYGHLKVCIKCKKETNFYKVKKRKCYVCQYCGYQISPLASTIFGKSSTSLKKWFYSICLFSISDGGISAKEIQRQIGVTYKCAWRITKKIKELYKENKKLLSDILETSVGYTDGKSKDKKNKVS